MKSRFLPPLIVLFLVLILWDLVLRFGLIPVFILPHPLQVLASLSELSEDFLKQSLSTLTSTLIGFFLSAILGFSAALVLSSHKKLKEAFLPFAIFFQTVPVVAIAPLLVIWFGFGEPTVRACAFIVSFFPVLANSMMGLSQSSLELEEVFDLYRANPVQRLMKLRIPASLAFVFSGLEIAAGLAVIGAIVGEFLAGGGLGGMIDSARTQQRIDIVFAAILLSSLLGILLVGLVRLSARLLNLRRPYFRT
jgi:NitT/TauT family transport system permease protein